MSTRFRVLALALVLAACGGGGGGGGGTPPPGDDVTPPPGDTDNFYPIGQGDTWYYSAASSEAPGTALINVRVAGTRNVLGRDAVVLSEIDLAGSGAPLESYYAKDARAYTYLGNNEPVDLLTPKLVPYDEMRFPVALKSFAALDKAGADLGLDLDGDGRAESFDASAQVTVDAFEPLITESGSYSRTARIRSLISGTLRLSSGPTFPISGSTTEWRAPGVGMIKQDVQLTFLGQTLRTSGEARGHRVGGVARGLLGPFAMSTNLAPANSDSTLPGRPAVASDGSAYLVVTQRRTGTDVTAPITQWIAHRVFDDGAAGLAIELSAPSVGSGFQAAAGFDGSNYLVVFDGQGLRGQRVSRDGSVLDGPDGLALGAAGGGNPALAYGGGSYLVVYNRFAQSDHDVFGVLVSPTGQVGNEFTIQSGPGYQLFPAVAFDGSNFLVVWEDHHNLMQEGARDILARRVSPAGVLLDADPIAISTAAEAQSTPAVACDSITCLVIWVDRRNYPGESYSFSPGPGDIYGTRVDKSGNALDGAAFSGGFPIAIGINANAGYPALAWTGGDYVVAWSRGAYVNNPGGPTGVFAARVSTGGTVTRGATGPGLVLSGPPRDGARLHYPRLAAANSSALAVWLDNIEVSGTTKSVNGTVIHPAAQQ